MVITSNNELGNQRPLFLFFFFLPRWTAKKKPKQHTERTGKAEPATRQAKEMKCDPQAAGSNVAGGFDTWLFWADELTDDHTLRNVKQQQKIMHALLFACWRHQQLHDDVWRMLQLHQLQWKTKRVDELDQFLFVEQQAGPRCVRDRRPLASVQPERAQARLENLHQAPRHMVGSARPSHCVCWRELGRY